MVYNQLHLIKGAYMPERNKHFAEWMNVKDDLHRTGRIPNVKDGDIWWCSVGENVGVEINGKSSLFSRPVLVLKKISRYGFLGVPLTSKEHSGSWYASFVFQDKKADCGSCASAYF